MEQYEVLAHFNGEEVAVSRSYSLRFEGTTRLFASDKELTNFILDYSNYIQAVRVFVRYAHIPSTEKMECARKQTREVERKINICLARSRK